MKANAKFANGMAVATLFIVNPGKFFFATNPHPLSSCGLLFLH
jgi:hypothetical protein